jgi:zinc transport system permease protein
MRRALLVGILLGLVIPCLGVVVVLRHLAQTGDALSHSSLAGIAIGLILGLNPTLGAMVACFLAAMAIEFFRHRLPERAETGVAVIMSAAVGLAGVASGFTGGFANFNNFLFGSIVAIGNFELGLVVAVTLGIFLTFILFYRELFFVALDEQAARLAGVPVRVTNFIFTILTAASVAVAARTVGALLVSSLMVVPVFAAMQIARSYFQTVLASAGIGVFSSLVGLFGSFYFGLKPGGSIVLSGIACLILIVVGRRFSKVASRFTRKRLS